MIKISRIGALAIAIAATSAWAQEDNAAPDNGASSWRDSTIAQCVQQYSAAQCQDNNFLEENFHISSLETAHRAAIQRKQQEQKALRELALQRVCSMPASASCSSAADSAQCIAELAQSCATLQADANNCVQNAQLTCAGDTDPNNCYSYRLAFCPSLKKQPIEQLLIKYPKLNDAQKSHLITTAAELDAQTGWWPNLIARLKTPFR